MINMDKIVSDFIEFEESNNLFEKKIQGIKFWSYVRFTVFWCYYTDKYYEGRDISLSKTIFKYILSVFQGVYNAI